MENVTLSATAHSDHSPSEHNGFTMSSSSSHDAGSPPPDSNSGATLNMEKKNKKKLSIGGSFTKFWKGNKKVKDNGENFYVYIIIELLFTLTNLVLLLKFNFLRLSISLYCGHHSGLCCYELLNQSAARAWFLEIALVRASVCVCVYVCVCVSAPEAINNQWRDMV